MIEEPFTVLVADDNPEVLLTIKAILRDYNLIAVQSGEEALRILSREHVNLVLLDMRMEGMSGIETARMIRTRKQTEDIPIIFMSGIDKNNFQVFEGYQAGAIDYIFKPFSPAILQAKISVFSQLFKTTEELKASKAQLILLTEEELRRERGRAREYLDIAGVMLIVLDREGCVTLLNRKGYEILGYEEGGLLGKDWFSTCVPARVRDEVAHTFRRLINGDFEPVEYYENLILTKQGEERIVAWHNTLLRTKRAISRAPSVRERTSPSGSGRKMICGLPGRSSPGLSMSVRPP